jgi:butyrate kinase
LVALFIITGGLVRNRRNVRAIEVQMNWLVP